MEVPREVINARPLLCGDRRISESTYVVSRCQNRDGGFGGGPGQLSHLAPTYAAVNALAVLGDREALEVVDRPTLARWLHSLRQDDGSFVMHADGEVDIRGVYCALSAASLANVYTEEMFSGTALWVVR